jgi:hypothetical protein
VVRPRGQKVHKGGIEAAWLEVPPQPSRNTILKSEHTIVTVTEPSLLHLSRARGGLLLLGATGTYVHTDWRVVPWCEISDHTSRARASAVAPRRHSSFYLEAAVSYERVVVGSETSPPNYEDSVRWTLPKVPACRA